VNDVFFPTPKSSILFNYTGKRETNFEGKDEKNELDLGRYFKNWHKTYFPNEKCNNLPAALSFFFPVDPVIVSCSGLENTLGK
jgi:hypothetical protein